MAISCKGQVGVYPPFCIVVVSSSRCEPLRAGCYGGGGGGGRCFVGVNLASLKVPCAPEQLWFELLYSTRRKLLSKLARVPEQVEFRGLGVSGVSLSNFGLSFFTPTRRKVLSKLARVPEQVEFRGLGVLGVSLSNFGLSFFTQLDEKLVSKLARVPEQVEFRIGNLLGAAAHLERCPVRLSNVRSSAVYLYQ